MIRLTILVAVLSVAGSDRDNMNNWKKNVARVYLYDSRKMEITDKVLNEQRVFEIMDLVPSRMHSILSKMEVQNCSYELIRTDFRNKVSYSSENIMA